MKAKYADIGLNKGDAVWLLDGMELYVNRFGIAWGDDIKLDCKWHGRYEISTGFCTINPPDSASGRKRPPMPVSDLLQSRFSVVRFYFLGKTVNVFEPSRSKRKMR